ncbi:MAG: inositol monophosphatase family protein [Promethearchaeota archaeon]
MEINIEFLRNLALDVYNTVHPLLGLKQSSIKTQRGAGGDISMQLDIVAERSIINYLEKKKVDILLISEEIGEKYIGNKEQAIKSQSVLIVDPVGLSDKCFFELNLPKKNAFKNVERLKPIIQKFHRMRILGSSALTLCQVARGSMEAFINLRESNRLVDVAAGYLILKEAGGKFFSIEGLDFDLELSINTKFPFIACNANLESFLKGNFSIMEH